MLIDPSQYDLSQNCYTVNEFYRAYNHPFNRQENNLSVEDASKFVEAVLLRAIPLSAILCKGFKEEHFVITNGIVWFNAIADYMEDKFALKAKYLTELDGKKFSEISRMYQRRIEETSVSVKFMQYGDEQHMDMLFDFIDHYTRLQ